MTVAVPPAARELAIKTEIGRDTEETLVVPEKTVIELVACVTVISTVLSVRNESASVAALSHW